MEKPKKEGSEPIARWTRHLGEEAVDLKNFVVDTWTGSGDNLAESTQPVLDALTPENIETGVGKVQLVLGDAGVAIKDGIGWGIDAAGEGLYNLGSGSLDYFFGDEESLSEEGLYAQSLLVTGESNWQVAALGLLGKIGIDQSSNS